MVSTPRAAASRVTIDLTINGKSVSAEVEARMTILDFLRDRLGLTGIK